MHKHLFVTNKTCMQAEEAMSEAMAAGKKAHDDMQTRLHAMQAQLDAAKANSSANAKVPDGSYRRVPAGF